MTSAHQFSQSVRNALMRDPRLVRLLGSTHIFEHPETEVSAPHITIGASNLHDLCWGHEIDDRAIVTLQVWTHSGERGRAQELLEATEGALAAAGFLAPGASIQLHRDYAGARKLPEHGEFQGILRYHAERQPDAA